MYHFWGKNVREMTFTGDFDSKNAAFVFRQNSGYGLNVGCCKITDKKRTGWWFGT